MHFFNTFAIRFSLCFSIVMAAIIRPDWVVQSPPLEQHPLTATTTTTTTTGTIDDGKWDWLEKPDATDSLEWAKQETNSTIEYLNALPQSKDLQEQLRRLTKINTPVPEYTLVDGRIYCLRKDATHKQGILEASDDASPGSWKTVVDIDELGRKEGKSYEFRNINLASRILGGENERLLLTLSDGGSDLVEVRELDIEQGTILPDGFRTSAGRISVSWLDLDHVLITHALNDGPTSAAGWPLNTYVWARDTDLSTAKLIHSSSSSDAITTSTGVGGGPQRRGLIIQVVNYTTIRLHVVHLDHTVEEAALPTEIALCMTAVATQEHLVVSLTKTTTICGRVVPEGTLVAWSFAAQGNERTSIVYVPDHGEVNQNLMLGGLSASYSRVYQTLSNRTKERRVKSEYQGDNMWKVVEIIDTPVGSTAKISTADASSDRFIASESGLLHPAQVWLEDASGTKTVLYSQPHAFRSEDFTVQVLTAQSKDGTIVDYILLAPKEHTSSPLPTLMTGYGAFGITVPIDYINASLGGVSLVPWLESGGALVIALIRGGSDRGEAWHQATMREKRQNSYNDFIAVAEKLIRDGLTLPQHLGVFGTSNGGLLAAVMGTQRPDLFGAVISDVPVIDMMRFPLMGMGSAWIEEYGDPKDADAAKVLLSYSPFHNIKPGIKYPPFLVTSSTNDDRVGPGHGRKLAAKLKEVNATAFLYEQGEGGHGVSDAFKSTVLMAQRVAFLLSELQ